VKPSLPLPVRNVPWAASERCQTLETRGRALPLHVRRLQNTFADIVRSLSGGDCAVRARTKGRARPVGVEQFELLVAGVVLSDQAVHILEASLPASNFPESFGLVRGSVKG